MKPDNILHAREERLEVCNHEVPPDPTHCWLQENSSSGFKHVNDKHVVLFNGYNIKYNYK